MAHDDDRYAAKRDRLARLLRLVAILQAHPDGIRTPDIAKRVGMSVRTAYRDLRAIEGELDIPSGPRTAAGASIRSVRSYRRSS